MHPAGSTAATAAGAAETERLATFGLLNHVVPFEPSQVVRPALMPLRRQREVKNPDVTTQATSTPDSP